MGKLASFGFVNMYVSTTLHRQSSGLSHTPSTDFQTSTAAPQEDYQC